MPAFQPPSRPLPNKGVALALCLAAAVTGCAPEANKADTGLAVGAVTGGLIGNTIGRGPGRLAATAIGAVVGGIVGSEIGRSLDRRDQSLARQAELDALERGHSGRPVRWRNPDNGRYGDVVPGEPFRRGALDCREYAHTIFIDGRPQTMRSTACRNPDGAWSHVG